MGRDTTSPFTPGRPVPVEFFTGRLPEIGRLRSKVQKAISAGNVETAFVSGERGIGKSSIASFVRYLSERENQLLGIHAFLGGVNDTGHAVKKVFDQLLKENTEGTLYESIKGLFGKHVKEVGLFGISVEFSADERELATLANNFAPAIRNLIDRMKQQKKGILLILDDINGLAKSTEFANWLKSLVDEIATSSKPVPLCIFLVGMDERRQALIECQPSLVRVLDPVEIRAWSREEARSFFERSFDSVGLKVDAEAFDFMTRYAGGLPVLAHEIGDAVFAADSDGRIGGKDVVLGIVAAADIVGRRYLDPLVYESIKSAKYRTILRSLSKDSTHERFTRASVRAKLPETEQKVLDNFLTKMKQNGVIVEDSEAGRGSYRFSNLLHYLYFSMESGRAELSHE